MLKIDFKERLAKRISKLKKRKYFDDIIMIIKKHNPKIEITSNNNGCYLYFHNLVESTYQELENYVNSLPKKTMTKNDYDYIRYVNEDEELDKSYSNEEKLLIMQKQRERLLCSDY